MKKQREQIDPDRLITASIAVLRAVTEASGRDGADVYPPDLMGAPDQPRCLCDFTKWEVAEATAFLIRLGYLSAPTGRQL